MGEAHLPEDLELPLKRGREWWHWLGGRPSVDFLNTRREQWRRDIETLVTPADLGDWLQSAGLLGSEIGTTVTQLRAARTLRQAIDDAVIATIVSRPAPTEATTEINRWLRAAATPQLLRLDDQCRLTLADADPADPIGNALGRIAADAAAILGTDQRRRLHICAAEDCSTRFYDASRAGTRQWCSMIDCGNVAKARRHRARQRTGQA